MTVEHGGMLGSNYKMSLESRIEGMAVGVHRVWFLHLHRLFFITWFSKCSYYLYLNLALLK